MLLSRHTMIGLAVLGATSAEGEGTSRVSVHKPGLHTNLKLDGSLWRTQGKHGRVAAVPRTLVKGLFSEPRRGDDSCGRASQARPQELFSTAAFCYDMLDCDGVKILYVSTEVNPANGLTAADAPGRFARAMDAVTGREPQGK